jgi:hypothetical protein
VTIQSHWVSSLRSYIFLNIHVPPKDPGDLQDLFEAVFVAAPELKTITKAITGYSGIELIQDNIPGYIEEQRDKPHFPTVFMITTDDRRCLKPDIEAWFAQSSL